MKKTRVGVHLTQAFSMCVAIASIASVARAAGEPAGKGEPVGKVASVQNLVETKSANPGEWTAAKMQQPLHALDRVRTGPASRAEPR